MAVVVLAEEVEAVVVLAGEVEEVVDLVVEEVEEVDGADTKLQVPCKLRPS